MDHPSPAKPDASVELSPSTTALDTSNDQRRRRYGSIHRNKQAQINLVPKTCKILCVLFLFHI